LAVANNRQESVKVLLEAGADPRIQNVITKTTSIQFILKFIDFFFPSFFFFVF